VLAMIVVIKKNVVDDFNYLEAVHACGGKKGEGGFTPISYRCEWL